MASLGPWRPRHPIRMMTRRGEPATIRLMSETFQTVRLAKGSHASPASGACVVEVASMLAGERFSDHPRTVCPVIAAFLRTYNDLLPDPERDSLYPCAAQVVGSASSRAVRRRRTVRLLEWTGVRDPDRPPRRLMPLPDRDQVVAVAARAAFRHGPERRAAVVTELLDELVAIGHTCARPCSPPDGGGAPPDASLAAVDGRADDESRRAIAC